jgi:response regulator of citrate/malate metabolism
LRMGAVQYLIKSQYKPSEVVKKVKEILAKWKTKNHKEKLKKKTPLSFLRFRLWFLFF